MNWAYLGHQGRSAVSSGEGVGYGRLHFSYLHSESILRIHNVLESIPLVNVAVEQGEGKKLKANMGNTCN